MTSENKPDSRQLSADFDAALERMVALIKKNVPPEKHQAFSLPLSLMASAFTHAQLKEAKTRRENRKLEKLSTTDILTGLLNRHGLAITLEREIGELQRRTNGKEANDNKKPVIVLMMADIDGFKQVNDNHPRKHAQGDDVLRNISKSLKKVFHRSSDIIARYGGDEIVIAMHFEQGDKINEPVLEARARAAIEKSLVWNGAEPLPVGASIGISRSDDPDLQEVPLDRLAHEMIICADARMYVDKWGPAGEKPEGYDEKMQAAGLTPKDARLNALRVRALGTRHAASLDPDGPA